MSEGLVLPYARQLKPLSRALRSSQTNAELTLWARLRRKQIGGAQFYRQKPLGKFIVDFYCPAASLVVEVDGGQHRTDQGVASDRERDAFLAGLGLKVLHFSNDDVLVRISDVVEAIAMQVPGAR